MLPHPKPLGRKSYGSIGHVPGSKLGPGDHRIPDGSADICFRGRRGRKVIVQEKLDGSNVAIARINGEIVPLQRRGYLARSSPYEQHWLFADWVQGVVDRLGFLADGERLCGEWLAQAHGTRYALPHEPFVAFDLFTADNERLTFDEFMHRVGGRFVTPNVLSMSACTIDDAMRLQNPNVHGAIDPIEGAVWRVESGDRVDYLAKYVRPDKAIGAYLPEISGLAAVWNWRPQ